MEQSHLEQTILQLQEEKRQLFEELQQCLSEKKGVQNSYEEALSLLSENEGLISQLSQELTLTKLQLGETTRELLAIKEVIEDSHELDIIQEEIIDNETDEVVDSSAFSLDKLTLHDECLTTIACKLCGETVQFDDLNHHSKRCSTSSPLRDADISKWVEDITKQDNSLQITLTRSNPLSGETAPFKVISKMRLQQNQHKCMEVYRSHGDFYWLHAAMQLASPERIVPPLQHQISLFETIIEFQRFLNRVASHIHLRTHPLVLTFLTGTNESIRLARTQYRQSRTEAVQAEYRPQSRAGEQESSLADTKNYLTSLEGNLLGLHNYFQDARKIDYGGPGKWLEALSLNEPRNTYTKTVISDISRIFQTISNKQAEEGIEDWTLIQNLQSTIQYITSARGLLERIEQTMEKYLFWDEEVQNCENINNQHLSTQHSNYSISNQGNSTPVHLSPSDSNDDLSVFDDSGMSESGGSSNPSVQYTTHYSTASISQKWAEANSHCSTAREELETMCKSLATELAYFDYLKENDIRNVLIDYATTQHEHMQKLQSKWYAMKLLLETPIQPENRSIEFIYEDQEAC